MKNLLFVIILFLVAVPGCGCFQAEHRNDPVCAILNQVVDCTESSVVANTNQFKPLVQALIAKATGQGGQIDWSQVELALGGIGVKDGGCILADVEKDYLTPANTPQTPMLSPALLAAKASYHENFTVYRNKKWPNVRFKVKKNDGSTVLL